MNNEGLIGISYSITAATLHRFPQKYVKLEMPYNNPKVEVVPRTEGGFDVKCIGDANTQVNEIRVYTSTNSSYNLGIPTFNLVCSSGEVIALYPRFNYSSINNEWGLATPKDTEASFNPPFDNMNVLEALTNYYHLATSYENVGIDMKIINSSRIAILVRLPIVLESITDDQGRIKIFQKGFRLCFDNDCQSFIAWRGYGQEVNTPLYIPPGEKREVNFYVLIKVDSG